MKTIKTLFIGFLSLLIVGTSANGQCISPDLKFANPTLVAGTALAEGAIYKFPNITPGIDCLIKLVKLNGGATLISMETPNQGYPDAWQPIIDGPGAPSGNKSWIDWEVSFQTNAGANYAFTCLDISAIDVDGDNGNIGEFVESDGQTSYDLPTPTLLTITDKGNGRIEAQGPIVNRPGIDTSAMDVRINYLYNGKDKIELKLGSTVLGTGTGGATKRLNCIYFKRIADKPFSILPVRFASFDAVANDKKVELNWITDNEVNNNYYEVERSFDGNNFSLIAMVLDAAKTYSSSKSYKMDDHSAALNGKEIVYYRLKQVDNTGKFSYSIVVVVRLQANKGISMQVSPNPFKENVSVRFTAAENGTGVIRMMNVTGQVVNTRNVIISKGNNSLQITNLSGLSKGIYAAQVVINGMVLDNQKIIKN